MLSELRSTKRTSQLKRALGAVIPALRKKFIAVHIALHAHGIAALHKGEETALGHVLRPVVATQTGRVDKVRSAPFCFDVRLATVSIIWMSVGMTTQP